MIKKIGWSAIGLICLAILIAILNAVVESTGIGIQKITHKPSNNSIDYSTDYTFSEPKLELTIKYLPSDAFPHETDLKGYCSKGFERILRLIFDKKTESRVSAFVMVTDENGNIVKDGNPISIGPEKLLLATSECGVGVTDSVAGTIDLPRRVYDPNKPSGGVVVRIVGVRTVNPSSLLGALAKLVSGGESIKEKMSQYAPEETYQNKIDIEFSKSDFPKEREFTLAFSNNSKKPTENLNYLLTSKLIPQPEKKQAIEINKVPVDTKLSTVGKKEVTPIEQKIEKVDLKDDIKEHQSKVTDVNRKNANYYDMVTSITRFNRFLGNQSRETYPYNKDFVVSITNENLTEGNLLIDLIYPENARVGSESPRSLGVIRSRISVTPHEFYTKAESPRFWYALEKLNSDSFFNFSYRTRLQYRISTKGDARECEPIGDTVYNCKTYYEVSVVVKSPNDCIANSEKNLILSSNISACEITHIKFKRLTYEEAKQGYSER